MLLLMKRVFIRLAPCSDLAVCDRGYHRDDADIPEDEAAHRHCAAEGGQQVSQECLFFFLNGKEHQMM